MMVNEVNNNPASWDSTVPQQMPWMSSYEPASFHLQFGQQPAGLSNMPPNYIDPHLTSPIVGFPISATTSTAPIITSPTSLPADTLSNSNLPFKAVPETTQSLHQPQAIISNMQPNLMTNPNSHSVQDAFSSINQTASPFNLTSSLTQLPSLPDTTALQQKRSSLEMEDEQIMADEPPAKQLLSESKLFKQFGSLNLDLNIDILDSKANDSDDSDEDERSQSSSSQTNPMREEFNRYVYLLFKDKKGDGKNFLPSNTTLDRLARAERDKLNKAVVLWNPSVKNYFVNNDDDSDSDEELRYTDHKDFLKKSSRNQSIIITEVFDQPGSENSMLSHSEPDNIMLVE